MPTSKLCIVCGAITDQTRCPKHRRGTTAQRGYGATHQTRRRMWQPTVDTGTVRCWRCGELIDPTEGWDLGHRSDRPSHPEHIVCNRGAPRRQ